MYELIVNAMTKFDASAESQLSAMRRALQMSKRKNSGAAARASELVLRRYSIVGKMLSVWCRDKQYIDARGMPIALAINGDGPTVERLKAEVGGHESVDEYVRELCHSGQAVKGKDGKLLYVGKPVVIYPHNAETALAATIAYTRHFLSTALNNSKPSAVGERGRLTRIVYEDLSEREFTQFNRAIRPVLENTLRKTDNMLVRSKKRAARGRGKAGGVCVFVYYDDGDIG